MNKKEIEELLYKATGIKSDENYGKLPTTLYKAEEIKGENYSIELVDETESTLIMDEENNYWVIFSVTKDGETRDIRFIGWWDSYDGLDFDSSEFSIVEQKQVVRSIWIEREK